MKIAIVKNLIIILISLFLLILGLIGNRRLTLRPSCQFQWTNKGDRIVITKVIPDGVAENAGIKTGDILLKINNQTIKNAHEFEFLLISFKPDELV
jgi:S1-C subfamily serine protease